MNFVWTDPAVQAALIQAIGGVLASTIAAVAAVIVGKRFLDQKRMQEKLAAISGDLAFVLAVEEVHCKEHGGKIVVRKSVRDRGLAWSGRFTPGRANHRIRVTE